MIIDRNEKAAERRELDARGLLDGEWIILSYNPWQSWSALATVLLILASSCDVMGWSVTSRMVRPSTSTELNSGMVLRILVNVLYHGTVTFGFHL